MGVARRGVGPVLEVTDGKTQRGGLQGRQMGGGGKGGDWGLGVQWLEAETVMRLVMGSEVSEEEEEKGGCLRRQRQ